MVLSHSKLKRKRKEELAAVVASDGPMPKPTLLVDAADTTGDVDKNKNKDKKRKKQKANPLCEGEAGGLSASNGAVGVEEGVRASEEIETKDKKTLKREKRENREKKKGRKGGLIDTVSYPPSEEIDVHHVENRVDGAGSNAGDNAEQPIVESGTTAAGPERLMSVREKKGKKKKAAKDRWGVKVAEEEEEETPAVIQAVREVLPTSTPGEELYDLKKVYVGGFPYYCTEDDIYDYFSECGVITELDCMTFPDTGNFRGIAFITFKTENAAAKALEYDGSDMGGRFLKIVKCKIKPGPSKKDPDREEVQKTPGSTSTYIGNLSWDVTEDVIKNFFKKSYTDCKIDAVRLAFDKVTGDFKGFGHVDFKDDASLEAAVKMNQMPLLGRPMKVAYSVPPKQHPVNGAANGKSGSAGTCYTCGEEGHKAFSCPKKGVNADEKFDPKKVAACYSCGEEGHKSYLCPKKKAT